MRILFKISTLLLLSLLVACGVLISKPAQAQTGHCLLGDNVLKDENAPFEVTAPEGAVFFQAAIKTGLEGCIFFESDVSEGCYVVSGIGTNKISVVQIGEESPSCQTVSHIEAQYEIQPTNTLPPPTETPTPTATAANTATPTPTVTLPPNMTPTTGPSPTHTPPPPPVPTDGPKPTPGAGMFNDAPVLIGWASILIGILVVTLGPTLIQLLLKRNIA